MRFHNLLNTPALQCAQQARSDDHGFPGTQLAFDFRNDVRIKFRALRQQHHVRIRRKFRMQIDGNANVAKIIVQEILADRLIRLVASDADRVSQPAQERIHLLQRKPSRPRNCRFGKIPRIVRLEFRQHPVHIKTRRLLFPRRAVASVVGIGTFGSALLMVFLSTLIGYVLQWTGGNYAPLFVGAAAAYLIALSIIHLLAPRLELAEVA